jgi:hypothetical protein
MSQLLMGISSSEKWMGFSLDFDKLWENRYLVLLGFVVQVLINLIGNAIKVSNSLPNYYFARQV